VHRTGELYGQFETLEQQKETATLGMWIFLVTEVLFFGGLFLTYTINRHYYFTAFGVGGNMLDLTMGTANTFVLIASSFTMAMSVWTAQTSRKNLLPIFLMLTLILGGVFLGIKYVEYKQKYDHHLIPGPSLILLTESIIRRGETIPRNSRPNARKSGKPSAPRTRRIRRALWSPSTLTHNSTSRCTSR